MSVWQLQQAKAKLTQLINQAKNEPQVISRHGVNETVVISIEKYEQLIGKKENLVSFLKKSPLANTELEFTRDTSGTRDIEL